MTCGWYVSDHVYYLVVSLKILWCIFRRAWIVCTARESCINDWRSDHSYRYICVCVWWRWSSKIWYYWHKRIPVYYQSCQGSVAYSSPQSRTKRPLFRFFSAGKTVDEKMKGRRDAKCISRNVTECLVLPESPSSSVVPETVKYQQIQIRLLFI